MMRVFTDPRFWRGTPARIVLVLVLANVFVARYAAQLAQSRRDNMLAATQPRSGAAAPRFDWSIGESLGVYLRAIPDTRSTHLAILAGMSQMYAINEAQPGDQTIAEWMDDMLAPRGTRTFGLAAPNLDNEDALVLLLATLADSSTRPDVFIYALCFDKMRFVDVRLAYRALIRQMPALRASLETAARDYDGRLPLAAAKIRATLSAVDSSPAARDDALEGRLRSEVAQVVPLVAERKELSNLFIAHGLYSVRNALLGIKTTSKRPIIQGRYDVNRELLLLMIDLAARRGVRFVMYINPLNPQSDNPYVPTEYDAFKKWATHVADSLSVPFANLEDVVPRDDWGLYLGGPDFKHFKGAGHRKTAEAVVSHFGGILAPSGNTASRATGSTLP